MFKSGYLTNLQFYILIGCVFYSLHRLCVFTTFQSNLTRRMESNTSHLIDCDNRSTKEYSMLMLNDYCLMHIFELLRRSNFMNLAKTCKRLQSLAMNVAGKIKEMQEIEFRVERNISNDKVTRSIEQFSDILAVFGRHIRSIEIKNEGSDLIFDTIRDNCEKLFRLQLFGVLKLPSQCFSNLTELKIYGVVQVGIDDFKNVFTSNLNIESLEVDDIHHTSNDRITIFTSKFYQYLQLLPKLKILALHNGSRSSGDEELSNLLNLTRLPHLTKLTLTGFNMKDAFLEDLATKSNLFELKLEKFISTNVHAIESFQNLEVLHISKSVIPESTIFPPKLKFLCLNECWMSSSELMRIVKQLKFLEVLDLGDWIDWMSQTSYIQHTVGFQSELVSGWVTEIGEQDIKIIYPDFDGADEPYLYYSNHLQIIRRRFLPLDKAKKAVQIPTVYMKYNFD